MGNRAVITFQAPKDTTSNSLGVYLHWNGGEESVIAFLDYWLEAGAGFHDKQYGLARFCQIVGNFFGGVHSLGIGLIRDLDDNNGDNGLFYAYPNPDNKDEYMLQNGPGWGKPTKVVDQESIRKTHSYFTQTPSILTQLRLRNDAFFKEGKAGGVAKARAVLVTETDTPQ